MAILTTPSVVPWSCRGFLARVYTLLLAARKKVSAIEHHKFNHDLLLPRVDPSTGVEDRSDQELAARKYPTILHVLVHPELQQVFSTYDERANCAKRIGRVAGFGAIGLGFLALGIVAFEQSADEPSTRKILIWLSALCGLSCFVIGSVGVLFARRKREWLHHRFMGELIRQFHFQTFVFRLPQILASLKDAEAKSRFETDRKLWFDTFKGRFIGSVDAEFAHTTQGIADPWLHGASKPTKIREVKELDPLFDAYYELRIAHQIGYADYKLQNDYRIFSPIPRRQAAVLSNLSFAWIFLLCVVDIGVLLVGNLGVNAANVVICIALAALATRAIEQGLQPEREVERYQQYLSDLRAISDRFNDEAASQTEKIQIMFEMERLVYDEMRNFLLTNERASFVM